MIKRIILFVILIQIFLITCTNQVVNKKVDIIADHEFTGKIGLQGASSLEPNIKTYIDPFKSNSSESYWMLAEWGSKYDLLEALPEIDSVANIISYSNKSKAIYFRKEDNQVVIGLEVLGSKEFEKSRDEGVNFPGILLGQTLKDQYSIFNFNELLLTLDTRLVYIDNKMKNEEYNESLHTAQITLYFSLSNINNNSVDYQDYLWFGIPIYDYRFRELQISWTEDSHIEGATQKFIYVPSAKEFYEGSMHDNKWISIMNIDILPYLKDAFFKAQKMGYLLSTNFEDLALTSTNFGWEIPGTFNAMYEFKNLRLIGTYEN